MQKPLKARIPSKITRLQTSAWRSSKTDDAVEIDEVRGARASTGYNPDMPIYEYRCTSCDHLMEVFAKMSDPPPLACEQCGESKLEKVLHPVAVHYKGSGFYATDYGKKGSRARTGDGGGDSSGSSASSGDSSSTGGDAKPASSSGGESSGGSSSASTGSD